MKRTVVTLLFAAAILGFVVTPVMAQTMPAQPPGPGTSGAPMPGAAPAPATPSLPMEKQVEGPVKKVDPVAKIVDVGWGFGLFTTKLEVTDNTSIAVEGKKGSLQDLQEGARVKASYEARDGKNIAKSIEAMPAEKKEGAAMPGGTPGSKPAQ